MTQEDVILIFAGIVLVFVGIFGDPAHLDSITVDRILGIREY